MQAPPDVEAPWSRRMAALAGGICPHDGHHDGPAEWADCLLSELEKAIDERVARERAGRGSRTR